jgi:hypothetical protein
VRRRDLGQVLGCGAHGGQGCHRWCRAPYAPENTPQRWYPFYVLGFNLVEGRWRPISEVELMMGLQDEYNTTRTDYAEARKDATPIRFFRKAGNLTEEDLKAIRTASAATSSGSRARRLCPSRRTSASSRG